MEQIEKNTAPKLERSELSMKAILPGFLRWTIIAIAVGLVVGGVATAFDKAVEWATEFRQTHDLIILLLPIAGIIIAKSYSILGMDKDKGTNSVLISVRNGKRLSIKMMLLIFFSTVLTHLCGGSSGREGAALQIGGSTAVFISRPLKINIRERPIITMCGMSAGFSALFGTPIAAAVFAMEVTTVGSFQYSALVPCVISAIVGKAVAHTFGVHATHFDVLGILPISAAAVSEILFTAAIAVLSAFISILFCKAMHNTYGLYKKYIPNTMLRGFIGGVIVCALTFLLQTRDYNGAGMDVITAAFGGNVRYEAFLLKILFTALTLGAGFKGGEIVPTMFIGATAGAAISTFFSSITPSFGAAIGLTSMFCGVTNCPLTTMILATELFGAEGLPYYAIAAAVSYLLSGYDGLYGSQQILFSKLRPVKIQKMTGK